MERDFTDLSESHPSIEVDGTLIGGADMKPGDEPFATMASRKMPDQIFRIAFAAVIGVCTDAADFGIAVEGEALAAHCDQLPVGANAEVRTHLAGFGAEEAGKCEVGEGHHLGCVVAGERKDFNGWRWGCDICRKNHLETEQGLFEGQFRGLGVAFSYDPDGFAGREERVKLEEGVCARRSYSREGSDVGRIAAGVSNSVSEVAMSGVQGAPHWIGKEAFWQVGHSFRGYVVPAVRFDSPVVYWESPGMSA